MFVTNNKPLPAFVDSRDSFIVRELLWVTENQVDEYLYQQLVSKVLRKPKNLTFHIQRIYLTYGMGMREQLYAALVDLLWVLDGKGVALSYRLIKTTQSLLTEEQGDAIGRYLKEKDKVLLPGNKFSVCVSGVISAREMVYKKNHKAVLDYDPLDLARDYIEYSQLDEALELLETECLKKPERQDLQTELLHLLKLTKNTQAFARIRDAFLKKKEDVTGEWQQLADYFAEIK